MSDAQRVRAVVDRYNNAITEYLIRDKSPADKASYRRDAERHTERLVDAIMTKHEVYRDVYLRELIKATEVYERPT